MLINEKKLLSGGGQPVFTEIPLATYNGVLAAGQDDFTGPANIVWDPGASGMDVTVTLTDPFLQQNGSPYYKYQRVFTFLSPGSLEP